MGVKMARCFYHVELLVTLTRVRAMEGCRASPNGAVFKEKKRRGTVDRE